MVILAYYAALFNSVFIVLGINYLYVVLNILVIICMVAGGLNKRIIQQFSIHILYILLLIISLGASIFLLDDPGEAIIAFGLYSLPILIWVCIYSNIRKVSYFDLFSKTMLISGLVGYIGVIQYFFNPTLWGLIPANSNALIWAEGKSFAEYALFFRATSIVGSPQVLSLFCALTLIINLRYKKHLKPWSFYFSSIGLLLGGMVTGSKLFFLLVFIYIFFSQFQKFKYILYSIAFVSIISLFVSSLNLNIYEQIPAIERVFSIEGIVQQEKEDSRIDRYLYIINETNPIYGNGLGSITNKSVQGLRAAESYIFKIYYEIGFITLLVFLGVCFMSFFGYMHVSINDAFIILLMLLGMLLVHAHDSPVFFMIWGYFIRGNIYLYKKLV